MSQSGPLDDISEKTDTSGKAATRPLSGHGRPLPPIGSKSASRTHSGASFTTFSSMHRGSPGENETEEEEADLEKKPSETAPEIKLAPISEISASESRHLKAYDGKEHLMVSLACQTEWSWMEDMKLRSVLGGSVGEEEAVMSSRKGKTPSRGGRSSQRSGRSTSTKSGKSATILPPYPEPRIDDEFGIPLADSSDESDIISDAEEEDARAKAQSGDAATAAAAGAETAASAEPKPTPSVGEEIESSKMERQLKAAEEGLITGVGPPQILQYLRESELPTNDPADPESRIASLRVGPGSACEFCGRPIPPIPSLEDQAKKAPEELFCCAEYRELLDYALKHPLSQIEDGKLIDIKPHPPFGSQKARKEAKERAEKRIRERELARQQANMLAAQSNFMQAEKARKEQEMKASRKERAGNIIMSLARQMKTINYQLSSMKCLDEGWTLRAPSPLGLQDDDDVFELDATGAERGDLFGLSPRQADLEAEGVFVKFYPNGRKFLTLFEDGTGNVFYPSGNLAILMTRTDLSSGLVTYVIFEDLATPEAHLLAIFDTSGHGTCYFQNGNIRLSYDQLQGIDLDAQGNRKRSWLWGGQLHVHAPPFQPLCFALNRVVGVRMTSREQIHVNFNTRSRNCRINVGAKLKLVNPGLLPKDSIDEERLLLEETRNRIATWLEKADNCMKYPHHPRLEKLPTSLHLKSQRERLENQKAKLQSRQEAAVK